MFCSPSFNNVSFFFQFFHCFLICFLIKHNSRKDLKTQARGCKKEGHAKHFRCDLKDVEAFMIESKWVTFIALQLKQ